MMLYQIVTTFNDTIRIDNMTEDCPVATFHGPDAWQNAELFPVFCDRTPRDLDALGGEAFHQRLVREWF